MSTNEPVPSINAGGRLADILGFVPAGVIFDMDGVLTDTEPINQQAAAAVLAHRGASLTDDEYRALVGQSNDVSWAWMIERFGFTETAAVLGEEYLQELLPRLSSGVAPAPGVLELVDELRASGIRLAVASSSAGLVVGTVLKILSLSSAFEVVVSGEEVEAGKPSPDIFQLAAERLGIGPSECLVIEDSPPGLEAARRAGMCTVAVETRYLPGLTLRADVVVDSLERLLGPQTALRAASSPKSNAGPEGAQLE